MLNELLGLQQNDSVLAALNARELRVLAENAEALSFARDEYIAMAGDPSAKIYVVLTGRVEAIRRTAAGEAQSLNQFETGQVADSLELIVGGRRATTLRALEESTLAALPREVFQALLEQNPDTYRKVVELIQQRLRAQQLRLHLSRVFGPFEPGEVGILNELAQTTDFLTLKSGSDLFRQDDAADAVYIVISGLLRVVSDTADGGEYIINHIGSGETVGEMALLTNERRSATVYAVRDSVLARIAQADFDRLIERYPRALKQLSRILIERLKGRNTVSDKRERLHTSVGLLPTESTVAIAAFAQRLADSIAQHGSVLLLSSVRVDHALGQPGVAQISESEPAYLRLAEWLHEQEERFRYLLYQADQEWTPWTERCARQADHIALIGRGGGSPQLGATEARLNGFWRKGREPRRKLVLLHPPGIDRPRGTRHWLAERAVEGVCHIREDRPGDIERLARILAGRAIGLVLGGGGARGFAHLGVIKALQELAIPIDLVAGSSIGSVMAMSIAQDLDADAAINLAKQQFSSLLDYTLPIAALLAGRRITRSISDKIGSWDIEDLLVPYFCVSTNLTTAKTHIHTRGDAARAVRASVSIPGVLPPVPEGTDLLVDGGVLNNLPIDIMRLHNPTGLVIAVDVTPPEGPSAKSDFGLSVSGWRELMSRVLPWRRGVPIPGIASTIMTSLVVGSARARRDSLESGEADYYLNIQVPGISMLQFGMVEEVAQIGYEESLEQLRKWWASGGLSSIDGRR